MRPIPTLYPLSACALAATLLVTACGGGAEPPPSIPGSTGFAVDDYIAGASVICDANSNGLSDTGEITTTTDSSGFFKFSPACTSTIVVTGGTNIDTGLPFVGKLKAPAGSTVVTPLTTLMAEGMSNDQVLTALGLPGGTDLKNVDPARKVTGQLVNPALMRKTLLLQQVIQKTTETLTGLATSGGDAAKASIYSEVAAALAATLKTSAALSSSTTSSSDAIAAVVAAAVQRVAASTTLAATVTAGAKSVNPASLAQVIAGGLKAQVDAILTATDANLISITKTVQSDTQVATFVKANAALLAGAPSTATGALASTLTAAVTISQGGGTTPIVPVVDGTLLTSFDESTPLVIVGFEGADGSYINPAPPAGGGTGKALNIVRSGSVPYAGVVVTMPAIPFAADRKTITARVYSPKAGIPFVLQAEYSQGNGTGDIQATPALKQGWQTLTWVMSTVDTSKVYTRLVLFPQLGTATGVNVVDNYYVDNIALAPASVAASPTSVEASCATSSMQCIGFAESTIQLLGFEGLITAEIANDPVTGAANKVAKFVKAPSGQPWAGATVYTSAAAKSIDRVGFGTSKSVTMRSNSGAAVGTKITLKFENSVDPTKFLISQAVTTSQNAWETLTFNFGNPTNGVYDANTVYDRASILPAWSEVANTQPVLAASTTFYFDELKYAVSAATPAPAPTTTPTNAPTTTIPAGAITIYSDAASVAGLNMAPDWGQNNITRSEVTIASNKSEKYVFGGAPFLYQGIDWTGPAGTTVIDVSGKGSLHLDLWSTDIASIKISLIGAGETAITKTLTAGSWNSIDIDLALFTAVDKSKTIQLKLEPITAGTLYVDNVYFWGTAAAGGGGVAGTFAGGIFANDYTGNLGNGTAKTSLGGNIGFFFDQRIFANKIFDDGSISGSTGPNPLGVLNFYYGIGKNALTVYTDAYFGAYVSAPGNATANASAYAKIKLKFWGDAETWERSNFTPTPDVILQGPLNVACTNPSGRPELKKTVTGQKIGAGSEYLIAKTDFTLVASCGGAYTAASVWSSVSVVVVQLVGASLQYVNTAPSVPPSYPTFINVGPISFVN